jgi:hypothetical protein
MLSGIPISRRDPFRAILFCDSGISENTTLGNRERLYVGMRMMTDNSNTVWLIFHIHLWGYYDSYFLAVAGLQWRLLRKAEDMLTLILKILGSKHEYCDLVSCASRFSDNE